MSVDAGSTPVRAAAPSAADVATAGFVATAVSYGPARMGFGLHLPQIEDDLALSNTVAGAIGAALFGSFLGATILASWLVARRGPRSAILLGCGTAAVGTGVVALAGHPAVLALGVTLAGASAGLCWTPFTDIAARALDGPRQGTALSLVSTGTALGIAAAGALEVTGVLTGVGWRWVWAGYAVLGVLAAVVVHRRLPHLDGRDGESGVRPSSVRDLGRAVLWPVGAAASFGLTSSLFLAFAADRAVDGGALTLLPVDASAGALFIAFGAAGLLGLWTAEIERRCGLRATLTLVFVASAASLALLAAAPTSSAAVLGSAALQGIAVMVTSALLSFWTARLFPDRAATAFTVVLVALGTGGVVGPAVAGVLITTWSGTGVFAVAAVVALVTAAAAPAVPLTPED